MADSQSLLAHILAQTRRNVELLVVHKQISETQGKEILSRLPPNAERYSEDTSIVALTQRTQRLNMSPAPPKLEARAIWDWTSDDPNDLSFEAGDIIEIITETNEDWWTGRNRSGKQGLFPSNYVEKIPPRSMSPRVVPEPRKPTRAGEQRYPSPALAQPTPRAPPQPYPVVPQYYSPPAGFYPPSSGAPPGAGSYYAPPAGPPPAQITPVPQEAPAKKSKFGGLGTMMAQSAASGAGFGAGAAIGGDIVNALF